jgi:hypothetical protein
LKDWVILSENYFEGRAFQRLEQVGLDSTVEGAEDLVEEDLELVTNVDVV